MTTHCLCGINHLRFLPHLNRCTLWTGGNLPWSLSEFGFVPHLACGSRIGPFPGSLPPAPSTPSSITAWKSRPTPTTQAGASPLGVVSDAVVAAACPRSPMPALHSGIQLKFRHLHKGSRIIGLRTPRVTHLAKKALKMRHKIPTHGRNPLKKSGLKGRD